MSGHENGTDLRRLPPQPRVVKLSARNLVVKNHPDENLIKIVMVTMTMMTLVKPGVVGEVLNISSSRECLTRSCCSLEPGQTRDKVDSPAPSSSLSQSSHLSDYVEI